MGEHRHSSHRRVRLRSCLRERMIIQTTSPSSIGGINQTDT